MIPIGMIEAWKASAPWSNNDFVEQDLILSRLLTALYSHEKIKQSLIFKGGTALHKLFLQKALRYSEDLDFDQISSEPIGALLDIIREAARDIFTEEAKYDRHEKMFILRYRYRAETPPNATMKVKIEINTRNHSLFQSLHQIHHKCESTWFLGSSDITTYTLEELLASKLKALYQRNKGRDLFDLIVAKELQPNFKLVNALYEKMLESDKQTVKKDTFFENIQRKLHNTKFRGDIIPLISSDYNYDIDRAAQFVLDNYL